MRSTILALFILSFSVSQAQSTQYLKVSGGKVFFGTGDVPGYAIYTEFSSSLGKAKDSYWRHFQLGGELSFETGTKQPRSLIHSINESPESFYHSSNSYLFAKLTYYPVTNTFLKGLNIAIGPTVGYFTGSEEGRMEYTYIGGGEILRNSNLVYRNYAFVGYKVSLGYDYYFGKRKRMIIGARIDFENNQKGDANTMYGGKLGYTF